MWYVLVTVFDRPTAFFCRTCSYVGRPGGDGSNKDSWTTAEYRSSDELLNT